MSNVLSTKVWVSSTAATKRPVMDLSAASGPPISTETLRRAQLPSVTSPSARGVSTGYFSTRLITPPRLYCMPYNSEAGPLSTSMRSMADAS